jgi:hypothetical protein
MVVSLCMTILDHDILSSDGSAVGKTATCNSGAHLRRRLRPLYVAGFLLGINFWVPVEKLFLNKIGFTAATVGLLAATYAAVVPFLEIPSGILADRWSRRGVLMIADVALAGSALVGGASHNVPMYLVSALLLGCYFALQSGTVDSIIYDVLVEETGSGFGYEREMGRLRLFEGVAFVSSALAGGVIAALTTPRVTYFLTIPFTLLAIAALSRLEEPRLHRIDEAAPLRQHVATTYQTIVQRGRLRPIIVAMVLTALLLQVVIEFGPLWMVALAAPAVLYGPQWAGLMSAMGLGGLLAGRLSISHRASMTAMAVIMLICSLLLTSCHNAVGVITAQVVLVFLLVALGTLLSRQFHDVVPSSMRAGVSSGVGTLTWVVFVPFALGFGLLSRHIGVPAAGWMIVALTAASVTSLLHLACRGRPSTVDDGSWVTQSPPALPAGATAG